MVPYCGGTLLPAEQRYTSPIFRRLRRIDQAEWLSLEEAAELVAWMRIVGPVGAKWMFQWNTWRARQARRLLAHPPVLAASEPYYQANLAAITEEDGIAAFVAMKEGGWNKGWMPEICRQAFRARRKRGATLRELAEEFGVSISRMSDWCTPRKPNAERGRRAAAVAALVL